MEIRLNDDSPMPFGKYGPKPKGEGLTMKDVPARYLHWLWTTQGMEHDKTNAVADYIRRNKGVLAAEYTDGIW